MLSLTLAVFRSAELGFLGFVIPTLMQTPLSSGALTSRRAGETAFRARWATRQPFSLISLLKWLLQTERRYSRGCTFETWLYVANGVGVAENWRTSEGVGFVFSMETDNGIRTDGMSDLRSIVTALVVLIVVVAIGAGALGLVFLAMPIDHVTTI